MCPACLTTLAIIAGGATSTGGVAAFVGKRLLFKKSAGNMLSRQPKQRVHSNGIQTEEGGNGCSESRVAG